MSKVQKIIEDIVARGAMVKIGRAGLKNPTGREFVIILVEADGNEYRARRPVLLDGLVAVNLQSGK